MTRFELKQLYLAVPIFLLISGCGNHQAEQPKPQNGTSVTTTAGSNVAANPAQTIQGNAAAQSGNDASKTAAAATASVNKYPAETLPPNTPVGSSFDWQAPSDGPYPTITKGDPIWIDCSLTDQRVRIMKDKQVIYTMITSSGLDGADTETPTGTYAVEPERDTWFYNNSEQEGAKYWVSWKDHGIFLFHSVAMDKNQQVIPSEAAKLGTKASHGCFRLTLSDAKWIFDNIPTGTKVVVHK